MTPTIAQQLTQVLAEKEQQLKLDPSFIELQAFLAEMERKGFLKKPEYTLPPIDTVGRNWHHSRMTEMKRI